MRDFAKQFYQSDAWKTTRALYINSVDGLCELCLKDGIYKPGKVVHHIKHLSPQNINDDRVTLGWDNLMLLCQDCHAKIHKKEITTRYKFNERGEVIAPH